MLRIFVGFDPKETVAYHVLCHSIIKRATCPISITPLNRHNLKGIYDRPRGDYDSTEFSNSRFIVPFLCNYDGWAVFMDCDMLCLGDVAEFARYMTLDSRWTQAVHVVKHKYEPTEETKFLNQEQTKYERKNWSSLMIFNNALCRELTPEAVNTKPGLWLHQFGWTDKIGGIPPEWNYLVGHSQGYAKLAHFTTGGPWFDEYKHCEYADHWRKELEDMNSAQSI